MGACSSQRESSGGTLVTPAVQIPGRLPQWLGRAQELQVEAAQLIPVCRIPGQGQAAVGSELFVHSTATERAFVYIQEGQTTKAIVCLLTALHSRLGKRNFFPQEASFA